MRLKNLNEWGYPREETGAEALLSRHRVVFAADRPFAGMLSIRNIAIVAALLCFFLLSLAASILLVLPQMKRGEAEASESHTTRQLVSVLVPQDRIEVGARLERSQFRVESRARNELAGDAVEDASELDGKYARTTILPFQVLTRDQITLSRPANSVAANIPEGYRAVTIKVDATTGVEGWAQAGANVDVAWVSQMGDERTITVIAQNAKVLSAERSTQPVDPNVAPATPVPSTVTLLVDMRSAQRIGLASTAGSLILLLRGLNDGQVEDAARDSIRVKDLASVPAAAQSKGNIHGYVRITPTANESAQEWVVFDNGHIVSNKQ